MNNYFFRSIQYTLILFVLMSCSTQSGLARKRPPKWVKQRPITPDYYVGIAVVKKNGDINYMQMAKEQALHDLCSEISVNVSANSILLQIEDNDSLNENFQSEIRTSLANEIEGYELVATWNNKKSNEYWVYYRLSKNKYQLLKRIKLNKAKKIAQNYYEQARLCESKLELVQALNYYAQAIDAIKKHLQEDVTVMTTNGKINLSVDIYNAIQRIFKNVQLTPQQKHIAIEISTAAKEPIRIKALWQGNDGESRIAKLPLEFTFTKGGGTLLNKVKTDQMGVATSQLSQITSHQRLQEIEVTLNLGDIWNEDNKNYKLNKFFFPKDLAPKCKISLNVKRLKAYLIYSETVFGNPSNNNALKNMLKKELSENFFSFTSDKSEAKIILNIKTDITKGATKKRQNYNLYITYLDCGITLIDNRTGHEIFNDAIYQIRGMQPTSYNYAIKEAYDEAVSEIHNVIVPKLNKLNLEN